MDNKLMKSAALVIAGLVVGGVASAAYVGNSASDKLEAVKIEAAKLGAEKSAVETKAAEFSAKEARAMNLLSEANAQTASALSALAAKEGEVATLQAALGTAATSEDYASAKAELELAKADVLQLTKELGATKEDLAILEDYYEKVLDLSVGDLKENMLYSEKAQAYFKKNIYQVYDGYEADEVSLVEVKDISIEDVDRDDKEFTVEFTAKVKYEDEDGVTYEKYDVTVEFALDEDDKETKDLEIVLA